MAKPEKNPLSGQCAGSEFHVWRPEGWGAGEYAQPSTTGSNALSQYWDCENWLWGEDEDLCPQQLLRNSGSCVPLLSGSRVPKVLARGQWTYDIDWSF